MPLVKSMINGQFETKIDIQDRALHYGDGLFETMLLQQGVIALLPQHLARLKSGCIALNLKVNEVQLKKDLNQLTEDLKSNSYVIKLIVSRGAAGRGLSVDEKIAPSIILLAYDFDEKLLIVNEPKTLKVCDTRLNINSTLGGIKHLNRLVYVLAAKELEQPFSEGIMLNERSEMIECITHNLFFIKKDTLLTAPIVDCGVAGIKRQQVLDSANDMGIKVKIKAVSLSDLNLMDECFITNAVVGVQSVSSIDQVTFLQNTMTYQFQKHLIKSC